MGSFVWLAIWLTSSCWLWRIYWQRLLNEWFLRSTRKNHQDKITNNYCSIRTNINENSKVKLPTKYKSMKLFKFGTHVSRKHTKAFLFSSVLREMVWERSERVWERKPSPRTIGESSMIYKSVTATTLYVGVHFHGSIIFLHWLCFVTIEQSPNLPMSAKEKLIFRGSTSKWNRFFLGPHYTPSPRFMEVNLVGFAQSW